MIPLDVFKKVRRIQIKSARLVTDTFAGLYHSAFKGRGMEFEDVREYQPGDEVRSIDWNVTARMDYPYVKNFREERQLIVNILVDVSGSSLFGSTAKTKKELIAEIAAVLALSAIRNHDKVGLTIFSEEVELYLPPKPGLTHVLRVIRELLVFEPKGRKTDIASALAFLGKVQKRRGVCFLLSDFISKPYFNELCVLGRRHQLFGLCVTDPRELSFPDVGLIRLRDMESGRLEMVDSRSSMAGRLLAREGQRRLEETRKAFHQIGAHFVDVRCGQDYLQDLTCTLKEVRLR